MMEGWEEDLYCEGRLRELELFKLENRRLQGGVLVAFQCLNGLIRKLRTNF